MTSTNSNPTGRIEGLDGLRAMAVLAVLGYHLRPSAVPGGFLGVDVFFVISGFLITTLLIREQRTAGRIDLRAFWIRRGRRLLPALVTVVATSIVVARLVDSDLLVNIKRQTIGAATFSTNWIEIGASTDYFDATSPLLFNT
ncbi:MAG: acyltransferase, partial [Acidimicrobiaceae bacterium]|nr:acyltransferase [Acidimicrobiaceae bacterium]